MIKHIVFFKFQDDVSKNTKEVKQRLENIKNKIPQIVEYEIGINITSSDRAYDMSLISSFNSMKDLKSYATNPVHIEVIEFIKSLNTITKVVDYEI